MIEHRMGTHTRYIRKGKEVELGQETLGTKKKWPTFEAWNVGWERESVESQSWKIQS